MVSFHIKIINTRFRSKVNFKKTKLEMAFKVNEWVCREVVFSVAYHVTFKKKLELHSSSCPVWRMGTNMQNFKYLHAAFTDLQKLTNANTNSQYCNCYIKKNNSCEIILNA